MMPVIDVYKRQLLHGGGAVGGDGAGQLGLAVDIVDANMQDLTDEQENTATQKWLMANSWRYGFIHRYPNGRTDITGII